MFYGTTNHLGFPDRNFRNSLLEGVKSIFHFWKHPLVYDLLIDKVFVFFGVNLLDQGVGILQGLKYAQLFKTIVELNVKLFG